MKVITVKSGQTIFDIALKYYGHIEGVEFLLQDNEFLSLDAALQFGDKLNVRSETKNQIIVDQFLNYTPVSNG